MAVTAEEVSEVVYAYVRGQAITRCCSRSYAASCCHVLGVPAVCRSRSSPGLCDVIPVVGVILATVPAVLLAVTVSPATAGIVFACYVAYHIVESYFLVPRIYGQRLRLSTLAVLLALLVGTTLQGLIGAVLVLPLVAAYPIIERIWLARYLAPDAVKDHSALAKSQARRTPAAVEAVLQGEKHPWEGPTGGARWARPLPRGHRMVRLKLRGRDERRGRKSWACTFTSYTRATSRAAGGVAGRGAGGSGGIALGRSPAGRARPQILVVGVGAGVLAGVTGLAASQEIKAEDPRSEDMMWLHGAANFAILLGATGLALWRTFRRPAPPRPPWARRVRRRDVHRLSRRRDGVRPRCRHPNDALDRADRRAPEPAGAVRLGARRLRA